MRGITEITVAFLDRSFISAAVWNWPKKRSLLDMGLKRILEKDDHSVALVKEGTVDAKERQSQDNDPTPLASPTDRLEMSMSKKVVHVSPVILVQTKSGTLITWFEYCTFSVRAANSSLVFTSINIQPVSLSFARS